jgi:signal transduction histidine kinase
VTFRARLFVAFAAAALVPLAALALGVRREMTRRLTAEYDRRVASFTGVIRDDLAAKDRTVAGRVRAIRDALAADTRFRLAAEGYGDRRWLLDYGADAMRLAGLDVLQLQDTAGRILTSGHFRNEYDQPAPDLARVLARLPAGPALARVRTAEGTILALVHAESLVAGGRRYDVVGGTEVNAASVAGLGREPELRLALLLPDDTVGAAPPDPASAGAAGERIAAVVPFPFADARGDSAALGAARLVVTQRLDALAALRRSVDAWFAGGLAATLFLSLALAATLAERVSRPLAELAAKTSAIDLDRLDQDFDSPRDDEIGRLSRLLGAMTDRLRTGTARLREAERRAATGDLARQVNHDVKNGLIPIRHVVRHLAEVAEREPERIAAVFAERRGTLDASVGYLERLSRSYAQLSPAPADGSGDLNAVVREVLAGVAPGAAALRAELADGLPPARGDTTILRRIVENLVTNAIESLASPAGSVAVTTGDGATDPATGARRVRLTVADSGRGMSRAELERAFDDFYTTKRGGTGLGLTVVRRLVADLGGHLRVETEPGAGSTFTVELPTSATSGGRA